MLAFKGRFLASKIARRLFLVFVLSALLPISVFGFLSMDRVERELTQSAARELRRETKAIGMEILTRLVSLEDSIRVVQRTAALMGTNTLMSAKPAQNAYWRRMTISLPDKREVVLVGERAVPRPELNPGELAHLRADRVLLRLIPQPGGHPAPTLVVPVMPGRPERGLILAEIAPDFLWHIATSAQALLCIAEGATPLWCNHTPRMDLVERVGTAVATRHSGGFTWSGPKEPHALRYWTIFFDSRFATKSWTVWLTEPLDSLQASAEKFKRLFVLSIGLALSIVILASVIQIRRYLVPLDRLREGTVRISEQNFSEPVIIESVDEFEELGASFNQMTTQLDQQFKLLETLAEIDRVVLSSHDSDYIVETLLERVKELLPAKTTGLIRFDQEDPGKAELFRVERGSGTDAHERQPISISIMTWSMLKEKTDPFVVETPLPTYLCGMEQPDVTHVLVLPILTKERLAALLCVGLENQRPELLDEQSMVAELANRTAVAMTNSDWEAKLYHQAHYDLLTGLPNRLLFRDRFEQSMARAAREGSNAALMFIDLDRFKSINDSLGHAVGDELLIEATGRFEALGMDTIARFGGDEFMVLVPDLPDDGTLTQQVVHVAESLCRAAATPFEIRGRPLTISASIGISLYPDDARAFDELLKHADAAMYHAKSLGKSGYQFYAPELNAAAVEKLELEAELRRALTEEQFELHYQPKIDARSGEIVGAEALVRWRHPERGMISPDKFIPLAEESGLIVGLGAWVLEAACAQGAAWFRAGLPRIRISVNLSANQFRDANLLATVQDVLKRTGLPPVCLELEVTEGTVMTDVDAAITTLYLIKEMGIGISVDDFGTGYSSLAYLAQFSLDVLKIDQSFVRRLSTDRAVANIVAAIIRLAHSLDLEVVAEGVETKEQLGCLRELNCEQLQGYFFSRPIPGQEFAALLWGWTPYAFENAPEGFRPTLVSA